ncbi:LysR family transcriptional regulator [Schauerella aestuarii]|uniref:LysR family transcriptional regulator n=1 Tax=Schauerella aestuarii TaxID=2511204 RepID=UPI00136D27D7|nr:LysR family transcriptional regulator [Achromobacter aestuarii]MYZ41901.1 LysR family transcriptional regulator [Achromobacter aestuarii]
MAADFDPYSLRLFLAVCEEGSIQRSAERESTVPSAVSKRMAALEQLIGLPLLRRGPKGMEPTEAGKALTRHAREVLASIERMRSAMGAMADGGEGSVRILASLAVLPKVLPEDLIPVLHKYPTLKIRLEGVPTAEMVRHVREGAADIGVCWDAADLSGLDTLPYREDHACVITTPGHPLSKLRQVRFTDVLGFDYVSAMPGSMMEIVLRRHAAVAGKTFSPRIEIHSFEGVARAVAAGLGVSVIPREVVAPMADYWGVQLIPLAEPWAVRRFVVSFRTKPYVSQAALRVVEALSQHTPQV